MGCLNSTGQFSHWFGNIHLSGPCNRSCYFCIGQHMMALDPLNTLDSWPLPGFDKFIETCKRRGVTEINLTGSNTDPLMYRHHDELCAALRWEWPEGRIGIRTNGVLALKRPDVWAWYDKASISVTSLNPEIYRATMGNGTPPDIAAIMAMRPEMPLKVNVVLCPETVQTGDVYLTLNRLADMGVKTVNLREPYGQPHIGDPLKVKSGSRLGMPRHQWGNMDVTYWDVHYVEVESVNLYANGTVSETYPITKGHAPTGTVEGQEHFRKSGRVNEQWLSATPPANEQDRG
jgi:hypothetical protein